MKHLKSIIGVSILVSALSIVGCNGQDDAKVVSTNLSTSADNFEINRRTVFYNGITDSYILSVEGYCSITKDNTDNQLELLCKTSPTTFKKHILGISDNVTYFSEQIDAAKVSAYHYRVIFKPQTIIPDIDFKGSVTDIPKLD